MNPIESVLFDLDGTLLDTAQDLSIALNQVRAAYSLPPLPHSITRPAAGKGCRGLLKLGFNLEPNHVDYPNFCEQLLEHYQHHLYDSTQLFSGMNDVLIHLEKQNIPWGIVTNKPQRFTHPLVEYFQLDKRAGCIISGDTLPTRKPFPDPILHACKLLACDPSKSLFVGDAEIDILASKAAGTKSLVALYGYIEKEENPHTWCADGYIHSPLDILSFMT